MATSSAVAGLTTVMVVVIDRSWRDPAGPLDQGRGVASHAAVPSPADTGPVAPSGASAHPDHPAGSAGTGFNLALSFETAAEASPDRELLVWRDRRITYGQTGRAGPAPGLLPARPGARGHAERAELAGHQSGQDHVALALYNGNEYLEGMLGGYRARVAPFNVNYRYVGEELRYLLTDARARAVIYHASLAPVIGRACADHVPDPGVLLQVADDSGNAPLPGAVDYEEALAAVDPGPRRRVPPPTTSTSSTPGAPPACPRGCCGASTTSSWPPWAGAGWAPGRRSPATRTSASAGRRRSGSKLLLLPPLMHGAAQWAAFY